MLVISILSINFDPQSKFQKLMLIIIYCISVRFLFKRFYDFFYLPMMFFYEKKKKLFSKNTNWRPFFWSFPVWKFPVLRSENSRFSGRVDTLWLNKPVEIFKSQNGNRKGNFRIDCQDVGAMWLKNNLLLKYNAPGCS